MLLYIYNNIAFFLFSFLTAITFTISDLSQFSLGFTETATFEGAFVRKVTSDKVYVGNLFEEKTFDIITKTSDNYYKHSVCACGTACPLIVFDNNNNPTHSVSKNGGNYYVVDLSNNNTQSGSFGNDQLGVYLFDENHAIMGARTSEDGEFAYRSLKKIGIDNANDAVIHEIYQNYEIGYIHLSDGQHLIFSQYTYFYYNFIIDAQLNFKYSKWVKISNGKEKGYYGIHYIIEISNSRIISCLLTKTRKIVRCFSGEYGTHIFTNKYGIKEIFSSSSENPFDSLSFIKWTDETGIIGYGIDPFQFGILNYDLSFASSILTVSGSDYTFIDFTVLDTNKAYFILATFSFSKYSYYGDTFSFPDCRDKTISIHPNENFPIVKLFTESSDPSSTFLTRQIKVTSCDTTNKIYRTSTSTTIVFPNVYWVDDLYFVSSDSITVNYVFYGITSLFSNDNTIISSSQCTFTVVVCNEFCMTCSSSSTPTEMNCDSCDSDNGYYRSEDSATNCYNSTYLPGKNYYLDKSSSPYVYRKCLDNCATCSQYGDTLDTKCSSCNTDKKYYPIEGQESNCTLSYDVEGYVFYSGMFRKCHSNCKTCTLPYLGSSHNCQLCKEGYRWHPQIETNCVPNCPGKWYVGPNYEYKCVDDYNCPDTYPLLVDGSQCVASCNDFYTCNYCIEHYPLYEYNGNCVSNCPNGISYGDKCVQLLDEKVKPRVVDNVAVYKMDSDINPNNFTNLKSQALEIGFASQNESDEDIMTTIKGKDYNFDFYPSDIESSVVKGNGSPRINLGDCEDILRDTYNISDDEELYISQIVYKNVSSTSASNPVQYEVYRASVQPPTPLDISPCNEVKISISQPILNADKLNLELGLDLAKDGIDIYNPNDPIFNDRCTSLSIDGKDVSMKDRREQVYQSATFCADGCSLKSLNLTINEIECECEPQSNGFTSVLEENEIFSTFSSILSSTNIEMFACVKLLSGMGKHFLSSANMVMIPVIVSILTFSSLFIFIQMKLIYSNLNQHLPVAPSEVKLSDLSATEIESEVRSTKTIKTKIPLVSSVNNLVIKNEGYIMTNQNSEDKRENIKKEVKETEEEIDIGELNEMDYRDAIKSDTRSFIQYFIHILTEKQIILSTILNRSIFYPLSLRLVLLFFTLSSFFFLNGLFFTEEYITDRYNTKETLDIWYLLKNELSKSVYSSFIGMFIAKFISMMLSSERNFSKLYQEKGDVFYYQNFKTLVSDMKKKYYIVITLVVILSFVYWYFLFIFCYLYQSNQLSWIQSSLFSILLNILLPIVICLIVAAMRIAALRGKISLLFNISFCLYQIF